MVMARKTKPLKWLMNLLEVQKSVSPICIAKQPFCPCYRIHNINQFVLVPFTFYIIYERIMVIIYEQGLHRSIIATEFLEISEYFSLINSLLRRMQCIILIGLEFRVCFLLKQSIIKCNLQSADWDGTKKIKRNRKKIPMLIQKIDENHRMGGQMLFLTGIDMIYLL